MEIANRDSYLRSFVIKKKKSKTKWGCSLDVGVKIAGTAVHLSARRNLVEKQRGVMRTEPDDGRSGVLGQAGGNGSQHTGENRPKVGARTSCSGYRRKERTWHRCRWNNRSGG